MAAARTLASPKTLYAVFFRSISSSSPSPSSFHLGRLRPLSVAAAGITYLAAGHGAASARRSLATKATSSSLNDPSPNWSNRPPKETILLDGCDFEHWLVVVEKPEGDPTRDEIIDYYIKTLAEGLQCSEDEARMKIYSVSTRCYYAFGALVSEELSYKLKELPKVRWVLPDSYLDVKNKDYGGEPFIDGKAVPYDPKYHEEWIRNHNKANERNRRNDRPRNFDRSRNFDRRRENMHNRDSAATPNQAAGGPPPPNSYRGGPGGPPPPPPNNYMGGPGGAPAPPPNNYMGGPGGSPPPPPNNYMGGPGGSPPPPPNNYMGGQQNMGGGMQNFGAVPQNNIGGGAQSNPGGVHQNSGAGWPNNVPGNMQQNSQNGSNSGGMPYQGGHNYQPPPNYQNPHGTMPGGNPYAA